ncbi:kinase-like protein [Laetiporus sulphureus 93-53]|uniref:Kinase-like protein n=1 Tax=Laetiporus sulphureus 93-53 TaxID=1314785 RepID=A0A165ESD0_9APHY|nr:kinase-like protein [Laetiporus sulphureus 93-53]KZT07664.1 kinase-like protein [Laetiporus sulphureus 93-53]
MDFVSSHTSVPIPAIRDAWSDATGTYYILMQRVHGRVLEDVLPSLTDSQRNMLARELGKYLQEIRSLPSPHSGAVCSLLGGAFRDDRLDVEDIGPFADIREYHDWRISMVRELGVSAAHQPTIDRVDNIRTRLRDDFRIVFTHSDLHPENVLVDISNDGEAHVAAIIDWEMAGWRPEYWEYVKCLNCMGQNAGWVKFVQEVLQPYEEEKTLDDELQRMAGEPY